MAIVNTLKIYDFLRGKFGDEQAKAVAEAVESSLEEYRDNQKEFLVTKEEFNKAISDLRTDIMKWMIGLFVGQVTLILGLYAAILLR
ncbi:MAG: hypothetical protein A2W23_08565 [Planctomycetes bacterium RBG_16_43_13]|nr:MAG: hypothetical protein A2W23_08565 [Planctomycetes bacterium RBG_16_43_13]